MRVENDTNDPVDYDQSSGGGDDDENPAANQTGSLNANGGNATFVPAGPPPWIVTFTDTVTNAQCTSPAFSNASVTVKVSSFSPCDVTVT